MPHTRRTLLELLAAATATPWLRAAPLRAQPGPGPAFLLAGDVAAGRLHVYAADGEAPLATLDLALAAHAGIVAFADGRVLVLDERAKELVVLRLSAEGAPVVERRFPAPIPAGARYGWAGLDPRGEVFAATSDDDDAAVELLTLVELATGRARQVRVDVGAPDAECGIVIGGGPEPVVFLHLAERLDAYRLADLMRPEAGIDALVSGAVKPVASLPLGKGGHSDSWSAATGRWAGSTLRGLEVATLAPHGGLAQSLLPWDADGRAGGRNARQRLTADGRHVFGPLNAALPPARWAEIEVDLHWTDLARESVARTPLARGLVGRGGVSDGLAVYASIHPDGDMAHLVDIDPASPTFRTTRARVSLPPLANGPVAGAAPEGREGRHAAITPDGSRAFVSQGGEGRVHVIDTRAARVVRTLSVPTPLKGGGYLAAVQLGAAPADRSAR